MEKYSIVKKSNNPKVIAMLSGGKDSIAAVILLKAMSQQTVDK